MNIELVMASIPMSRVAEAARESFGDFAKAVVDIERNAMALGGEMHVDGEALLLQNSSRQEDVWGVNLYPDRPRKSWIEFDSMVNIRPRQGNRSREVKNEELREKISTVVNRLVL